MNEEYSILYDDDDGAHTTSDSYQHNDDDAMNGYKASPRFQQQ